jgi:uncharacterized protein YjiS (DUF1127 family)
MRDYVLFEAQTREALGFRAMAKRIFLNWRHQKDLQRLLEMDDCKLNDLGLTRELVQQLFDQPLTMNVDWERERLLRLK